MSQAYFWFPKLRLDLDAKLDGQEQLHIQDQLPQAALVWKSLDVDHDNGAGNAGGDDNCASDEAATAAASPMIIVDGNHRSTLFLASSGLPETIKVVIFHVDAQEYAYYEELLHQNYLSCLYGHVPLETLRQQHLKQCQAMFEAENE